MGRRAVLVYFEYSGCTKRTFLFIFCSESEVKYSQKSRCLPALVLGTAYCEVEVAILVKIKVIAELERNTVKLCYNGLRQSSFRTHFKDAKVSISNVEVPCLLVEPQSQRTTTNVLIFQFWCRNLIVVANF